MTQTIVPRPINQLVIMPNKPPFKILCQNHYTSPISRETVFAGHPVEPIRWDSIVIHEDDRLSVGNRITVVERLDVEDFDSLIRYKLKSRLNGNGDSALSAYRLKFRLMDE
jgi:hypothetical protein